MTMEKKRSGCGAICSDCRQMENLPKCQKISDIESLIGMLEGKGTSSAYEALQKLERISDETGLLYSYTEKFVNMINSSKYVIRVRGFRLFCKQAKWDRDHILDENIDAAMDILKDEKPTAVRQALAALPDIIRYKSDLREIVENAVSNINHLRYNDTVRNLIAKDIENVLCQIRELGE